MKANCPHSAEKKRLVLMLAVAAVGVFGLANVAGRQASASSATQRGAPQSGASKAVSADSKAATGQALAVGRVIYAELSQTIEAKKAKVGGPIAAKVTLAVLSHGSVLIAQGAKISGHVTEAKQRSKKHPESVLGIVFDRAELKDGGELPLALTVQAVGVGGFWARRVPISGRMDAEGEYSAVAAMPGVPGHRTDSSGPSGAAELPEAAREPALDLGSKGVVGLSDLDLKEGTDSKKGSLVTSTSKDVKLDHGDELVLRVIAPKPAADGK
jgi:hypothetical protein